MAVGFPSLFPESSPPNDSPVSQPEEATARPPQNVRLTEGEFKALHQFLLLLDKWDRQKNIA